MRVYYMCCTIIVLCKLTADGMPPQGVVTYYVLLYITGTPPLASMLRRFCLWMASVS